MQGAREIIHALTTPTISGPALSSPVQQNRRAAVHSAYGRMVAIPYQVVSVFYPSNRAVFLSFHHDADPGGDRLGLPWWG